LNYTRDTISILDFQLRLQPKVSNGC